MIAARETLQAFFEIQGPLNACAHQSKDAKMENDTAAEPFTSPTAIISILVKVFPLPAAGLQDQSCTGSYKVGSGLLKRPFCIRRPGHHDNPTN